MSRAEERAKERYRLEPCNIDTQNKYHAYIEGDEQAGKDLELTWKDIKEICVQSVLVEVDLGGLVSDERHYTEVLKRFKDYKERKEKSSEQ